MSAVIWHNPRCSKSRQTLSLLNENGVKPLIVDYQKTPPSIDEIKSALDVLEIDPIKLMRTNEKLFKERNLSKTDSYETLIKAMHTHPILIERPVVFLNGKAAIGRPPEAVLKLL